MYIVIMWLVTARIQTYPVAVNATVLFGLAVLVCTGVTTTADSQASLDKEKINRQLEQVVKVAGRNS
jgi:threonine/homoserine/homoserine lactone efflux protein